MDTPGPDDPRIQRLEEAAAFDSRRVDQMHEQMLELSRQISALTRRLEALEHRFVAAFETAEPDDAAT